MGERTDQLPLRCASSEDELNTKKQTEDTVQHCQLVALNSLRYRFAGNSDESNPQLGSHN